MAIRSTALGSIVSADFAGVATTYTVIGLVTGFTPPARPGTEADGKTLGDTLDVPIQGIEGPAEFVFTQFYQPAEPEVAKIDLAFDNRNKDAAGGGVVSIRVAYPHDGIESGDTMPTEEFDVNVMNIGPESIDEPNSTFKRVVTCRRITDITPATFLVP